MNLKELNFCLKEKISRVLHLWTKYSVIENDIAEKLNRISSTAKLDAVLNGSNESIVDETASTSATNGHSSKLKKTKSKSSKTKASSSSLEQKSKLDKLKKLKHIQEKLIKQQKQSDDSEIDLKETKQENGNGHANLNISFKNIDSQLISELHKITSELITNSGGKSKRLKRNDSSPQMTTKHEISKVLYETNEFFLFLSQ